MLKFYFLEMSSTGECTICAETRPLVKQQCCNGELCMQCFERCVEKCPFCNHEQPPLPTLETRPIKRRRVQVDEEWRPFGGLSVNPRSSIRVTRRTVYIYDFESDEVESVDEIDMPADVANELAEDLGVPATEIEFPRSATVVAYLPPAEATETYYYVSETETADEGVEETKGDN